MSCPRCSASLVEGRFDGVPVAHCGACEGVLVEIRHNVPFLDALARQLARDVDPETEIEANPGPPGALDCPRCAGPMARFGYLGTNRVFLDRCERCSLLWHDGAELVTTALLHARTNRRSDERRRAFEDRMKALDRLASNVLLARAAMDRAFVGTLG